MEAIRMLETQKLEITFSAKLFFSLLIIMNLLAFVGVIWSLANNANITPTVITEQVYSALMMFLTLQVIFFVSYYAVTGFKHLFRNSGTNEKD